MTGLLNKAELAYMRKTYVKDGKWEYFEFGLMDDADDNDLVYRLVEYNQVPCVATSKGALFFESEGDILEYMNTQNLRFWGVDNFHKSGVFMPLFFNGGVWANGGENYDPDWGFIPGTKKVPRNPEFMKGVNKEVVWLILMRETPEDLLNKARVLYGHDCQYSKIFEHYSKPVLCEIMAALIHEMIETASPFGYMFE